MQITDAEAQVMDVLWRDSPLAAEDIAAALSGRREWELATVKTFLNRLLKKGAVIAEKDGRRYLYRPALAREDYVHAESASLLSRLFGGRVAPLVAHFSERRTLSRKDIAELKRLLEELDRDA